jgi:hypothetical protein
MSLEQIQTLVGQEQNLVVPYDNINLRIVIQFDDYEGQWFCNLLNDDTEEVFINGIYLKLGTNALFGYGLDFGLLALIDIDPTNTEEINLKNDLGDRVQLVRDIDA